MFKPVKTSDTIQVVSVYDPAIDWNAMCECGKDKETLRSEIHNKAIDGLDALKELKFKAGEQPTYFTIGVIPSDILTSIQDQFGQFGRSTIELRWRCFLSGLRDVSWNEKPEKRDIDGVSYVDPSWSKKIFVRGLRTVALEIGMYVWQFNRMTEDEARL